MTAYLLQYPFCFILLNSVTCVCLSTPVMQRRDFLKTSSVAGLTTLALAACNTVSTDKKSSADDAAFADDFELNEVTIDILQQKMQSKEYTSRSITEKYLKRIDAIDKAGPKLNAIIQLNPDALKIAD